MTNQFLKVVWLLLCSYVGTYCIFKDDYSIELVYAHSPSFLPKFTSTFSCKLKWNLFIYYIALKGRSSYYNGVSTWY